MKKREGIVNTDAPAGRFGDCLIGGTAEEKKRGRKIKRRAIALSVALQSLGLTALVIAPILAKTAEIKITSAMPIPPYNPARPIRTATTVSGQPPRHECVICPQFGIRPITPAFQHTEGPSGEPRIEGASPLPEGGTGLNISDPRKQPPPPDDAARHTTRIHEGHIDPAMLVNRVEPVFPPLLRQLRRNARVELRAVIAIDGTIQSLQVVSGDPLCVQSALAAVRQWRYKPTLLNGQPVEVDTFITVIYTVNQQ